MTLWIIKARWLLGGIGIGALATLGVLDALGAFK